MRTRRKTVLRLARDLVAPRHRFCGLAHDLAGRSLRDFGHFGQDVGDRHHLSQDPEVVRGRGRLAKRQRGQRVNRLLRQVERRIARGVRATGDHDVGLAALDRRGRERDGLQTRRTGARAGHAFDARRQAQVECDLARDVRRVRRQNDAAPNDAVDLLVGKVGALEQRPDRDVPQVDAVELEEFSKRFDERGANAGDDDRALLLAPTILLLGHAHAPTSAPPQTRTVSPVRPTAPGVARKVIA